MLNDSLHMAYCAVMKVAILLCGQLVVISVQVYNVHYLSRGTMCSSISAIDNNIKQYSTEIIYINTSDTEHCYEPVPKCAFQLINYKSDKTSFILREKNITTGLS